MTNCFAVGNTFSKVSKKSGLNEPVHLIEEKHKIASVTFFTVNSDEF